MDIHTKTPEPQLIALAKNNDTKAFEQLIIRYQDAMYRHTYSLTRDEDAAQDMTQECFISAYNKINSYKAEYKFSTWLFRIATNLCLDWHRKNKRYTYLDSDQTDSIPSDHKGLLAQAQESELHERIATLRPEYQLAISLHYWHGLTYEDAATAMDIPLNTFRTYLLRAKRSLRKELQ